MNRDQASEPRAKGLAFRSVMKALEHLEGADAVARSLSAMPVPLGEALRYGAMTASGWFPLADYRAMWDGIQTGTGNRRDVPRAIGRECVRNDLNVVHRFVMGALSTETVIRLATRIFNSYYDTGKASAEWIAPRTIRVRWWGCTGFSRAMWTEVRGSVEMFAEVSSAGRASCSIVTGGGDEDAMEADVRWL